LPGEDVEPPHDRLELVAVHARPPRAREHSRELLGAAAVGQTVLPDPLPAPHLRDESRIDGDEAVRVATRRQVAEDTAVEAELGLGDEVEQIVRLVVVVARP
jgi:hypothetical protein